MIFEISPLLGINDIKFGMSMGEVRGRLSAEFHTFNRNLGVGDKGDFLPTDSYQDLGFFCHFTAAGFLEAMDFFPPSRPVLEGVEVIGMTVEQGTLFLKRLDPAVVIDSDGVTSDRLSLGFREDMEADEDDPRVGSFFAGRLGYY
ncbi:MAG: hypothetical protein EOO76_17450 [Novosphingobium sp.]|nr:MAG: hypothetical protein EOO76_17450 [Novosphingobium sp.]